MAIFQWREQFDRRGLVDRAVDALRMDELVVLPTETVYGIAARAGSAKAVEKLAHCKGRPEEKPMTLALRSPLDMPDWIGEMGRIGQRLSYSYWPGPLTIVMGGANTSRLPEDCKKWLWPQDTLGFRVPAHEGVREIIQRLGEPIVLTSANQSGCPDAITGAEAAKLFGETVELVIVDGETRYGHPSTVIRLTSDRFDILREGCLSAAELELAASKLILFVCTGNTCRSPMAEGISKKTIADQLGCGPEELARRGYLVLSAGVAAIPGGGASQGALDAARKRDVCLDSHVSSALHEGLMRRADLIFSMTEYHCELIRQRFGSAGDKVRLLCPKNEDVADPVGSGPEVYDECAQQISDLIALRIGEILAD